ncbi:uncharacterized protein [Rutidosis leptorrhynchoides]|uniref:uncharacterized protein n=1 Tax=Rutidosis leptorrhynchoides TaxID=125765 RepID=UPI003A991EE6
MDLEIQRRTNRSVRAILPRILWKNLSGDKAESFRAKVVERVDEEIYNVSHVDMDRMWNSLASTIRGVAKESLGEIVGTFRGHKASRESWWISEKVQAKVAVKHVRFRELITLQDVPLVDRTRAEERYKEVKREAKKAVARAKDKAYEELYKRLDFKEGANDIFKITKARERRRRDLDNIKFIKDEAGQSIVKEDGIRKRWEEYFSSLFIEGRSERNDERDDTSIEEYQNNCPCSMIKEDEVREALRKMGRNKCVGQDQIPIELWRCLGDDGVRWQLNGDSARLFPSTRTKGMLKCVVTIGV